MVLIYTPKITARKQYIFTHIFKRLLDEKHEVTSDISTFVAHTGIKFSYAPTALGNEMHVWSHNLLVETGVSDQDIEKGIWQGLPTFFKSPDSSVVPFDIFAASFYLISRYEEYFPQMRDELGRYKPDESTAARLDFIEIPVVDLWIAAFWDLLCGTFKITLSRKRNTSNTLSIEVGSFYKYKGRGLLFNFLQGSQYLKKLNLRKFYKMLLVLTRIKPDPFNNYQNVLDIVKDANKSVSKSDEVCFLFDLGNNELVGKTASYQSRGYREVIKHIADYVDVGVRYTLDASEKTLQSQSKRYEDLTHLPLKYTVMAYGKISMPDHYKNLVKIEGAVDRSMGYYNRVGYRAGTSVPFYFYDLDYEVQTPLLIQPYAIHYDAIKGYTLNGQNQYIDNLVAVCKQHNLPFHMMMTYESLELEENKHVYRILKKVLL